jgi:hypothetical protein
MHRCWLERGLASLVAMADIDRGTVIWGRACDPPEPPSRRGYAAKGEGSRAPQRAINTLPPIRGVRHAQMRTAEIDHASPALKTEHSFRHERAWTPRAGPSRQMVDKRGSLGKLGSIGGSACTPEQTRLARYQRSFQILMLGPRFR